VSTKQGTLHTFVIFWVLLIGVVFWYNSFMEEFEITYINVDTKEIEKKNLK
jgi:hypothetical protein